MRVSLAAGWAAQLSAEVLALPVAAGQALEGVALELDGALGGLVSEVVSSGEHRGRFAEFMILPTSGRLAARRLMIYGLGSPADLDGQRLRAVHQEMVRTARTAGHGRIALVAAAPLGADHLAAVVEGAVMGAFDRRSRGTGRRPAALEELLVWGYGEGREAELVAARRLGEATNKVREWQNTPANEMVPETLADEARRIASAQGLEVEVLGPEELRAGGYNLLLGVAAGSAQPPRMIRLEHRGTPPGTAPIKLALVGKGITFDSGGLSIKPADSMRGMKDDMTGAAAVLAAVEVIAERRVPIDVMAVVPASENMLGPAAQKPGDVVVSANGLTVEVLNTDAEGRLALADALTYAIRRGATHIVDICTLTGAALHTVGHVATPAMAGDEELWAAMAEAAELAGERIWRLPIYPEHKVLLASRVADLRNSYYGEAGTIMGGLFIREFAEGRPWGHLDIAASSWNDNAELVPVPRGPSGAGTRLLVHLAERLAARPR